VILYFIKEVNVKSFETMLIAEFNDYFDRAINLGNYTRGDKLSFETSIDKERRMKEVVAKFRRKGLL
jgi:hypothetical protein